MNDEAIDSACRSQTPLIEDFDPRLISNCTYSFRIGRLFEAGSGDEIQLATKGQGVRNGRHVKILGPNETAIIETRETINLPQDVMATYSPLNSLASHGLMLLNSSVVEPGYSGPLSCVLVNFSSQDFHLTEGQRITKAVFVRLTRKPAHPKSMVIDKNDYSKMIATSAARYHRSFLNIDSIVEKAKTEATAAARKGVVFGGIFLAVLLIFAQMEPFLTKWLREKTGIVSSTSVIETERKEIALERIRLEHEKRFANIEHKLDALENSKPNREAGARR